MAQYEMNLRDYWLIVRRRRMIIIASTILVAVLSFGFARQKVPIYQATAANSDLKRLPTEDEVTSAILFLASDLSSGITGQTLDVNCGEYHT